VQLVSHQLVDQFMAYKITVQEILSFSFVFFSGNNQLNRWIYCLIAWMIDCYDDVYSY